MSTTSTTTTTTTKKAAIIVGISGSSSSGKTTLSRLLRDIFPGSFILHQDDFYKPDDQIPLTPNNHLQDWDCVEALDMPRLIAALTHIHTHGLAPSNLVSKEDLTPLSPNNTTSSPQQPLTSIINELKTTTATTIPHDDIPTIAILDGFLLYGSSVPQLRELLDIKIFLRTRSFEEVKRRRENRAGYVTTDGFWKDPPGYVEEVVWPAYVREHAWLFEHGDVLGVFDEGVLRRCGIRTLDEGVEGLGGLVRDAVGVVVEELRGMGGLVGDA